MKTRSVFYFGKFVVMGFAGLALFTYVVMLLWNWLIPELFTGPLITYWQTLGILILSKILFTGVIGHGRRPPHPRENHDFWSHDSSGHREYWKKKFEEKMNGKMEKEEQKVHEERKDDE